MVLQSLAGLPAFLVYFCTAIIAVIAYLFIYTRITPHNELELIRNNNAAAAIALGLSRPLWCGGIHPPGAGAAAEFFRAVCCYRQLAGRPYPMRIIGARG